MIDQIEISLPPFDRGYHIITELLLEECNNLPKTGIFHVFIKHSSAALTINENADPSVRVDFETSFNKLFQENAPHYTHNDEGPDDMPAHLKASTLGSSVSIPITNHQLNLGMWQGIYLCEFRDYPSPRNIVITISS